MLNEGLPNFSVIGMMLKERLFVGVLACLATSFAVPRCSAAEKAGDAKPIAAEQSATDDAEDQTAGDELDGRIHELIAQLGADNYFARERAQQALAQIGFEAFDALIEAEDADDIEVSLRAKYLVRLMRVGWVVDSDPPEVKALLDEFERKAEPERLETIHHLAELPDDLGLAVLCRMVRFEKSPVISKAAAAAVIGQPPSDDEALVRRRDATIRRGIGHSLRPGAVWLRQLVAGRADPASAIDDWSALVAAEESLAERSPQETRPEIAAILARQQAVWLRKLGREQDADVIFSRLVAREPRSAPADSLMELIEWLADQSAWQAVDELQQRFAERIDEDPMLLYSLAYARRRQGRDDLVQKTIAQALALGGEDFALHFSVSVKLQQKYRMRWAEGELRRVVELSTPDNQYSIVSRVRLSELLHDRGDDLAAAKLLEGVIADVEENVKNRGDEGPDNRLESKRARMHYFHACHLISPTEHEQRVKHLLDAIDEDDTDADVLIALYRTEDLDPPLRDRTRRQISAAVEDFRRKIQENPEDPTPYNMLAWLVANTEGDKKEALQCSLKSLELVRSDPAWGGSDASLIDTLGRCYYAVGDYQRAVETQAKAVKLDADSGLMNKQLEMFREELSKSKSRQPSEPSQEEQP
jgi:tetratricopeptide (TPR) repeat protein